MIGHNCKIANNYTNFLYHVFFLKQPPSHTKQAHGDNLELYDNVEHGMIGTEYEKADTNTKMELVVDACKEANAWEFIQTLTDGLDTEVGELGLLLSGG